MLIAGSLVACAGNSSSNEANSNASASAVAQEKVATEEYIAAVAQGLENRWAQGDVKSTLVITDEFLEAYKSRVQSEQDAVAPFSGREFEDETLGQKASEYSDSLVSLQAALDSAAANPNSFNQKWSDAYNIRAKLITDFVTDYGLTVSSENAENLESVIASVPSLSFVEQSVTGHDYGYYHTSFTVRNDGTSTVNTISLMIKELDEEGNVIGSTYPQDPTPIEPGQSIAISGIHKEGAYSVQVYGYTYYIGESTSGQFIQGKFSDTEALVLE